VRQFYRQEGHRRNLIDQLNVRPASSTNGDHSSSPAAVKSLST
jgi:hypothetical protein